MNIAEAAKRLSIAEAAKRLGMSQEMLRLWIQHGTCPFGEGIKKYTRWNYYICETRLNAWISGKDIKSATCSEGSALSD